MSNPSIAAKAAIHHVARLVSKVFPGRLVRAGRKTPDRDFGHLPLLLLVGGFTGAAHAQMYKCVEADGRATYQTFACASSAKEVDLEIRDLDYLKILPGNMSLADARRFIDRGCVGSFSSSSYSFVQRFAQHYPQKVQAFCHCVADKVVAQPDRLYLLSTNRDVQGTKAFAVEVGEACRSTVR